MKKIQTQPELDPLDGTVAPSEHADVVVWVGATAGDGEFAMNVAGRAPHGSPLGRALAFAVVCVVGWVPAGALAMLLHATVGRAWVTALVAMVALLATGAGAFLVLRHSRSAAPIPPAASDSEANPAVVIVDGTASTDKPTTPETTAT